MAVTKRDDFFGRKLSPKEAQAVVQELRDMTLGLVEVILNEKSPISLTSAMISPSPFTSYTPGRGLRVQRESAVSGT